MNRRRFISTCVLGVPLGFGALAGCRRKRPILADAGNGEQAVTLNASQWKTMEAACARILPSDEDPGAREAAVVNYIDGQLAHSPVSGFRRLMAEGLRRIELICRRMHKSRFSSLAPEKQDRVLQMVQRGHMGGLSGRKFFDVLVVLTIEGFLCDPVYGGNRNRVGWKFFGFEPQQPSPSMPYRCRLLG